MSRRPGVACALLQGCYQGLGIVELGVLVGRSVGSKMLRPLQQALSRSTR